MTLCVINLPTTLETSKECVSYTFLSEYAVEDIKYTLEEIFPADVKTWSADHICTIKFPAIQYFVWPGMDRTQDEVITDLTKISSSCLIWGRCPPTL